MLIASYPEFVPVNSELVTEISEFTKTFEPYSDFSSVSLYCWNANNNNAISILKGNLIIKIKDYLNDNYLFSILGKTHVEDSIDTLLDNPEIKELSMVPETVVKSIKDHSKYVIKEDRDSEDYILNVKNFISTPSKNLRKKINQFESTNSNINCKILDITEENCIKAVLELNKAWCKGKGFSYDKSIEDQNSIEKFLEISSRINAMAVGVYINDVLIGFTLNEILNSTWAMGHFGKSDINIKYSSLYCEYASEKLLSQKGIEYINIQQDTGLPGLRETKMSYHPEFFLKKYTVTT